MSEPLFWLMYAAVVIFFYLIFTGTIEVRYKGRILNQVQAEEAAY